ncbi:unnamed protein product [Strongylus vulgaris]|uniref:Uncharacterized protein n=1 Tax=Strongylus vulgaris TaxID=40348 RepID=A0A3P7JUD9_STRVU|nr:unnamed protein product [Strongylus vulgaris]
MFVGEMQSDFYRAPRCLGQPAKALNYVRFPLLSYSLRVPHFLGTAWYADHEKVNLCRTVKTDIFGPVLGGMAAAARTCFQAELDFLIQLVGLQARRLIMVMQQELRDYDHGHRLSSPPL